MKHLIFIFGLVISHQLVAQSLEFENHAITTEKPYVEIVFEGNPPSKGYKTTLLLTNTAPTALLINKIEAGCSCIKAKIRKKKLKQGKTTALIIEWNPSGDTEFSGAISLQSNDPVHPELWIHLIGGLTED